MKNKYTRLVSDTVVFFVGNFLTKLIQYFLLPLYTSVMTTSEYGTAELLNNLTEVMYPIITLGVYEAVFRFAIDKDVDKDAMLYEAMRLVFRSTLVLTVLAAAIYILTGYQYTIYVWLILVAHSFRRLFAFYARGMGYSKVFSFSGVVTAVFLSLGGWIFLTRFHMGVQGYLLALAVSYIASSLYLLIRCRVMNCLVKRRRNKELLTTMLRFSVPMIFMNIAWWVTSMSNRYVVLFAYGASVAGLYTAANKLPSVISLGSTVFKQAWQLNSSRELQEAGYAQYYEKVLKLYVQMLYALTAVAIALTPLLAKFTLKNEFFGARQYIPMMMLSVLLHCIAAYFESIQIAYKKSDFAMQGMLIGATLNLVLSILLVRPLEIWGILIANIVCYLCLVIHRIIKVRNLVDIECHFAIQIPLLMLIGLLTVLMSFSSKEMNYIGYGVAVTIVILCIAICRNELTEIWSFSKRRLINLMNRL